MAKPILTAARLRDLLSYDAETGVFSWKVQRRGTRGVGSTAGKVWRDGYIAITIDGRFYLAHRLAWFHEHGVWPEGLLDHRNRIKADNRIDNLRVSDRSKNSLNRVDPDADSRGGVLGVQARGKRFVASIAVAGKRYWLGTFGSEAAAGAAYVAAKERLQPGIVR